MTNSARHLSRTTRAVVAATLSAVLALGGSAAASAAGSSAAAANAEAALRIQAQMLAGQIQSEGRNLDRLAESLDAAQIRRQQLASQLHTLQTAMARTDAQVTAARAVLKEQALLSYLAGGAPLISTLPNRPGSDPSVTVAYAEIVSGGQRRAVAAYRTVLSDQGRQAKQLADASTQVAVTVAELQTARRDATEAVAAQQRTLAQVKGHLAILVAQVQAAQQRATQAAVKAKLASQGQVPPASTPPPRPGSTAESATSPTTATPAPTSAPPQTAPPSTSPPTTAPPPPPNNNVPARGWRTAVHYAYAQLGKPYQWGGAGPNSFDCSGLTMMAWQAAGVYLPHLAQAQYDLTTRIPLGSLLPGDLVFFGTPSSVGHVGIYIGSGQMIDAPSTGLFVSISSIYWSDLLGAGRIIN